LLLQAAHSAPLPPHAAVVGVTHWLPMQQPVGHEVASQTHALPKQRWPPPHAAAPPQVQTPLVQPLALVMLHEVQVAPGAPHAAAVGGEVQTPF
jgi:hypothetical protein